MDLNVAIKIAEIYGKKPNNDFSPSENALYLLLREIIRLRNEINLKNNEAKKC
jgi:hypothetical protein